MIAYWLMPEPLAHEYFASLISDLAGRFDAPLFEPHLSIYVEDTSYGHATRVIKEVAAEFDQIQMSVAGLRFSEEFWKTVFVQFFASPALTRLSEAIQSRSADAAGYHLDPHLSLIYKTMAAADKNKLAASLRLPFDEVIFDSVAVISAPNKTETRAGIESWEKISERPLKS